MSNREAIKPLMAKVVSALVELVDSAEGNWIKPWVNLGLGKQYRSNGELYRGTNQMFLGLIAVSMGLEAPHVWAGYSTWHAEGWTVRRGEKSPYAPIYTAPVTTCKTHGKAPKDQAEPCCGEQYTFMLPVRVLAPIFHRSQVEAIGEVGYCNRRVKGKPCDVPIEDHARATLPPIPVPPKSSITPPGIIEAWREAGMETRMVDSDRAYYSPGDDYINLPPVEAFTDEHGYLSTVFHEATHWTGHSSRLARPNMNVFGTPAYAFEELVAEMGSAMTGVVLGFEPEPHPQHAEYLKSWLKALEDDPTRLYDAAVEAEKASTLLLKLGKVRELAA